MREHKFRGIDKIYSLQNGHSENVWRYGNLVTYENGQTGITSGKQCGYSTITSEVIPETVGEYTCLPDKGGREICEGDILQADDPRDRLTFSVKWYEDNAGFNLLGINTSAFAVIGNIHENPDLLNIDGKEEK